MADTIISIQDVSKNFGKIKALKNININIKKGYCLGLIGPNGAGKTTLIMIILGIISPTSGEVFIHGKLNSKNNFVNIGKRIGIVIDHHALYEELTAIENLSLFCAIMNDKKDFKKINHLLKLTNLWHRKNDMVKTYSKGMKQRLSIARSLLNNPSILIMDEPLNSLDPESHRLILDLIKKLNREEDVSFFITSHNLYDLEQICSKIALIKKGQIIKYDTIKNLIKPGKQPYKSLEQIYLEHMKEGGNEFE